MIDSHIKNILIPINDDLWIIIETTAGFYNLNLGGFSKILKEKIEFGKYNFLNIANNLMISDIRTDNEWLYIKLLSGELLSHGWINIDFDGNMSLGILFQTKEELSSDFQEWFYDIDMIQLKEGLDGYSISL